MRRRANFASQTRQRPRLPGITGHLSQNPGHTDAPRFVKGPFEVARHIHLSGIRHAANGDAGHAQPAHFFHDSKRFHVHRIGGSAERRFSFTVEPRGQNINRSTGFAPHSTAAAKSLSSLSYTGLLFSERAVRAARISPGLC